MSTENRRDAPTTKADLRRIVVPVAISGGSIVCIDVFRFAWGASENEELMIECVHDVVAMIGSPELIQKAYLTLSCFFSISHLEYNLQEPYRCSSGDWWRIRGGGRSLRTQCILACMAPSLPQPSSVCELLDMSRKRHD